MESKPWNPGSLLQLSGSYWSTCALHAGVKLDVFTAIAASEHTAAELAEVLRTDCRALEMLLVSLTALGLVTRKGEGFRAVPFASQYLAKTSPDYLGHIIMHHHHLVESWARLDEGVRTGGPVRPRVSHEDDEGVRESFLMGMYNLAMQLAPLVVQAVDLKGRRRLLDLGGGPGTYAIQFCRHYPELTAAIYDLPATRRFAQATVERFGLAGRIGFTEMDFEKDQIQELFDVAWLSHILHGIGPAECATLLAKTAAALEPGGLILIQEFVLDDTQDGPLFPALFSLNMLLGTENGQAYTQRQLTDMLAAAGLRNVHRLAVELPNGAGIIAGTKPQ